MSSLLWMSSLSVYTKLEVAATGARPPANAAVPLTPSPIYSGEAQTRLLHRASRGGKIGCNTERYK
eukprot:7599277-Pyramimonas_sp.AAC.1